MTGHPDGDAYIPAEADVSIRPGWFYHPAEDDRVKSLAELVEIYFGSVGRGANLLLNVPPDRRGLIHEADAQRLHEFGEYLKLAFRDNLTHHARVEASNIRGSDSQYAPQNVLDDNFETYWATDDGVTRGEITLAFPSAVFINCVGLQEYVRLGQRVEEFVVEGRAGDDWSELARGTTIGYKRLLRFPRAEVRELRIRFLRSRGPLVISEIGAYDLPPVPD